MQQVWYVAYGSNLCRERFLYYLHGGRPARARRTYPGSRDATPPRSDAAVTIPGGLRFVGESLTWGGGLAVYDREARSEVAARAYLITTGQFADVVAQETRSEPGLDIDLTTVTETGTHSFGDGHYQTLTRIGTRDELPMLTFTSGRLHDLVTSAPSEGYVRTIATGLVEAHGWTAQRIGRYLARFPGAVGSWTPASIAAVAA